MDIRRTLGERLAAFGFENSLRAILATLSLVVAMFAAVELIESRFTNIVIPALAAFCGFAIAYIMVDSIDESLTDKNKPL